MAKSNKEKSVLKRAKAMKYSTDRLGPGSLMIQQSHTNSSRIIMVNHQLGHMVSIKDPEQPLVPSGFENKLASFGHMLNQSDGDYVVVAKFVKNEYNYVIIGFDKKRKIYHAWKREEVEEHSESFCTRYDNKLLDSLEIGDTIPKGTYVQKSTNYDKFMNYQYGKNINVVYTVSPHVYEDGILAMNGVDKMFDTYRSYTVEINLADNEVLLNWYGDKGHYQGIPMIGEKTKKGFLAIVRRIDNSDAPYNAKDKRMRHIEPDDKKYYMKGRVIDIDIRTNKDPAKMLDIGATRWMNKIYEQQQEYYKQLYRYMQDIVDGADDGGYTYSDDFSIICSEAFGYVDSSAFFADATDTVYGNTKIVVRVLDDEHMIVGSKFVGRSGNKGVIARILPPEESWKLEDGTPIHFAVATLGIIGRLNQSQLNEHSINELSATAVEAMKMTDDVDKKIGVVVELLSILNPDEAKRFKKYAKSLDAKEREKMCRKIERRGIVVIQEPVENANIIDIAEAYEIFPPNYRHIVYPDGEKSLRKVLCAKMFYTRLKQDPLEKYSSRSKGPVNPLTTLPSKSTLRKKFLAPWSDVAVRFGEMELEILMTMCNHPAAVADFMMESSTSYTAKLALAEHSYLGNPEDVIDMDLEDIEVSGKKNVEWISAYLQPVGTEIDMDVEVAPEGEWFYD